LTRLLSEDQFKKLFRRQGWACKNLKLTEAQWVALGGILGKRSREGKESDVYVSDRLAGPHKIKRHLDRYREEIDRLEHTPNTCTWEPEVVGSLQGQIDGD